MTTFDEAYWSERYASDKTGWDMGTPSRPLMEFVERHVPLNAQILIPGAGNGHEAIALFERGWKHVHVCDLSPLPLEHIRNTSPDFPREQLIRGDFFELSGSFDCILEQTFFCAIEPSLRDAYVVQMAALLKPGGQLSGVLFDFPLTEKGPPFGGSEAEYRKRLSAGLEVVLFEPCQNSMPGREGKEFFFTCQK